MELDRSLIREIICLVLFLIIIIPICVDASNRYNRKEEYLNNCNNVYIEIHPSDGVVDEEVFSNKVVVICNENRESMKIQLIFKIAKFTNSYTLKLGDRIYNLDKLEYREDENYLYFNLGEFEVREELMLDFQLVLNNGISYDSSVRYSFLVEGV